MTLTQEIEQKGKEIQTDSYPMSIGELTSMYKEGELGLNPDFQRFFRWDINQKSKLIESILLGIPIPSIFVSQDPEGRWDVIDGLQRLSTIFEFMGILETASDDGTKKILPPLQLEATEFLPSLKNKLWEKEDVLKRDIEGGEEEDSDDSFNHSQRFKIKRAKLTIQIIKETSDPEAKYELFQRLNTGGTNLKPQEVRNCILLMVDKSFFSFIEELANNEDFLNSISISEKLLEEQYEKELVVRYLIMKYGNFEKISGSEDIHDYLTKEIVEITKMDIDYEEAKDEFSKVFKLLKDLLEENSFKKYREDKGRFMGAFSLAAFEVVVGGFVNNLENIEQKNIEELVKGIYSKEDFKDALKQRPIQRFRSLLNLGKEYF